MCMATIDTACQGVPEPDPTVALSLGTDATDRGDNQAAQDMLKKLPGVCFPPFPPIRIRVRVRVRNRGFQSPHFASGCLHCCFLNLGWARGRCRSRRTTFTLTLI